MPVVLNPACGTLNMIKNLAAHLNLFFYEKDRLEELIFTNCKYGFLIFLKREGKVRTKKLTARLEEAYGTPVEKHFIIVFVIHLTLGAIQIIHVTLGREGFNKVSHELILTFKL